MPLPPSARWRSDALGPARRLDIADTQVTVYEAGAGRPVVLVHGFLTNANVWRKLVPQLAAEFRCVCVELPLGSHATPLAGTDLTPPGLAKLLAATIEALGLGPVTLVGNDTGGAFCQMVAAWHPEVIDRLVLTDCEFRENFPPLMFRYLTLLARFPPLLGAFLAPGMWSPMQRLPFAYGWLARRPLDPQAAATYTRPAVLNGAIRRDLADVLTGLDRRDAIAAADALAGFDRPALIVWSPEDRVFPPKHARALAELLPQARLEWVRDAYAFLSEDQPTRLATLVAAFARESADTATAVAPESVASR
jgi:pimeloyl-ACP methyl ester carboxylesterase